MAGVAVALAAVSLAAGIGACDSQRSLPARLADGTSARLARVEFEGVAVPVVVTKAGTPAARVRPPAACAATSRAVDRVGVAGVSRTTLSSNARELRACDWTPSSTWCGSAFALVREEQPLDPRLSITCQGAGGAPVGFVWITPGREAAYLVVGGQSYAEAYPVVPSLPVRVTTAAVERATSSAAVDVSEHALDGRLLRVRRIEAQVSG